MIRVSIAVLALVALCYGQATSPCYTMDRAQCGTATANVRCIWVEGRTCNGRSFGGCVDATLGCAQAVTCTMWRTNPTSTPVFVTFGSSCIPILNFTALNDFTRCTCQSQVIESSNPRTIESTQNVFSRSAPTTEDASRSVDTQNVLSRSVATSDFPSRTIAPTDQVVCNPRCPECSVCERGVCVTPSFSDPALACTANSCPRGYTCDTTNPCFKRCVPGCPTGSPVQCLVDPCSLPYPPNCPNTAKCVASYCGGCNRKFFDDNGDETCLEPCTREMCGPQPASPSTICPDGTIGGNLGRCERNRDGVCAWIFRDCPNPCLGTAANVPPTRCTLYCPYGFEVDNIDFTVGNRTVQYPCPACRCKQPPTQCPPCTRVVCRPSANGEVVNPVLDRAGCCPVCPDPCDLVNCPQIRCAPDYVPKVLPGTCCPTCIPNNTCSQTACPQVITPCPAGSVLVRKDCCPVCERRIDCTLVTCDRALTQCPPNYKLIFGDGDCCPRCEYKPPCDNVSPTTCPPCPTGTTPVRSDLSCCPICQPIDFCATVRCAAPNCSLLEQIKRPGQCCNQCPTCRDTPNVVCKPDDNTGCKAGFFTGDDCTTPIPPDQRVNRTIVLRFCRRGATTCDIPDAQTLRILIAALTGADATLITVEVLGRLEGNVCCIKISITITSVKGGSVNVDQTAADVNDKLVATGDWSSETGASGTTSAASTFSVIAALAFAFLALLM